eukprot:scaffold12929_cov68-Phaeocystis_antarctica.AAC.1
MVSDRVRAAAAVRGTGLIVHTPASSHPRGSAALIPKASAPPLLWPPRAATASPCAADVITMRAPTPCSALASRRSSSLSGSCPAPGSHRRTGVSMSAAAPSSVS